MIVLNYKPVFFLTFCDAYGHKNAKCIKMKFTALNYFYILRWDCQ